MTDKHFLYENIPFSPDADILKDSRFFNGHRDSPHIRRLWQQGTELMRPKALVLPVSITHDEDGAVTAVAGTPMRSKLLDHNLKGLHRAFAYVATCGEEIMSLTSDDEDEKAALFVLRFTAVRTALEFAANDICRRFDIRKYAVVNPGSLPQWPISEQEKLFAILGCVTDTLGVTLLDGRFMQPAESVSGLLYETDTEYRNCMICSRKDCIGRNAPFDPALADAYK